MIFLKVLALEEEIWYCLKKSVCFDILENIKGAMPEEKNEKTQNTKHTQINAKIK